MASYAYAVTLRGETWIVVNRKDRSTLGLGSFRKQADAEAAAEKRARLRARQGHSTSVYVEDEEGAERLRHKYEPPVEDSE